MEQPIFNPPNPYVGRLRLFPGTLVKVAGRARPNATRFAINFQTGPSLNPRDDLALHLSPCFTPPRVVRNSLQRGAWGLEEAWGNGTIVGPHQPFEIMILVEADQFKIAINGAHFCEFRHRIPYVDVTHLTIDGDVDIDRITISSSTSPTTPAYQPSAPPSSHPVAPPYPSGGAMPMPTPSAYPTLPPSGPYPSAYPPAGPPVGPMPTGATYMSGYPQAGPYPAGPYPAPTAGAYPQQPYPGASGASYHGGHQQPHSTGQSTSTPFGNLPIGGKALGTLAGLGLGAAAGAAVLSAVNPMKHVKKMMKPKLFKHHGYGRSSSSSSNSSRSSFSSNSS